MTRRNVALLAIGALVLLVGLLALTACGTQQPRTRVFRVDLGDGHNILCIGTGNGGISCDWPSS